MNNTPPDAARFGVSCLYSLHKGANLIITQISDTISIETW